MNKELEQINRHITKLSLAIDSYFWKGVFLTATPQDYVELKSLQTQVNEELEKRNILIENLRHEESILKENAQ